MPINCNICGAELTSGGCPSEAGHIKMAQLADAQLEVIDDQELDTHNLDDYCDIEQKDLSAEFFDVDAKQPDAIVPFAKYPTMVKHHVTKERRLKVRLMKVAGIENEVLAKCLGISQGVLHKYYKADLEVGLAECTALVAGKLMEKIRNGDTASIIFYLRTRGKWAPKNELEITHSHTIRPRSKEEIELELMRIGVPPEKLHELTE